MVVLQFLVGCGGCLAIYVYYLGFHKYRLARIAVYILLPIYVFLFTMRLNI